MLVSYKEVGIRQKNFPAALPSLQRSRKVFCHILMTALTRSVLLLTASSNAS